MLFTDLSVWAMIHGLVLGGAALMALSAALFSMYLMRRVDPSQTSVDDPIGPLVRLSVIIAAVLWVAVLVGTYIIFPPYRVAPPEGAADLSQYPRALILGNPETAWLHSFGMEIKEHVPWIAAMLATAVAFVCVRYRSWVWRDAQLRNMAVVFLAACFVLVAFVGLMGVFITRVAPLQ